MTPPSPRPKLPRSFGFRCAVVLVVGSALYALSFGPACWLDARLTEDGNASQAFHVVYRPFVAIAGRGPYALRALVWWYASVGLPDGRFLAVSSFVDERGQVRSGMHWLRPDEDVKVSPAVGSRR